MNKKINNYIIENSCDIFNIFKIKIYVLMLNCKNIISDTYSLLNKYTFEDIQDIEYIDNIDNIDNIENNNALNNTLNNNNIPNNNIYIFGKKYFFNQELIKKEINNINFFCYRSDIPIELENHLNNDIGWGCMIRTGQMMLCKVLKEYYSDAEVWFYDTPEAYFSIHNITSCGKKYHIPVGNWFNPSGLAYTLKHLVNENEHINKKLKIVLGRDGYLYENEIEDNISTLILIPIMLGINKINSKYIQSLLNCFEIKYSVGIIGGKPRKSFYFIGKKEDNIFFLDPHIVKPAIIYNTDKLDSESIKYIDIFDIDPCMLLCFLVKSKNEFNEFKIDIENKVNDDKIDFSLFTILQEEKVIDSDMNFENENLNSSENWIEI